MRLSRRPSAPGVLAFIALMVALGGTALAATGQLVNIADGSNAARIAHVDSAGSLQTGVKGTVFTAPRGSATFDTFHRLTNFYTNGSVRPTLITTSATLGFTSFTFT